MTGPPIVGGHFAIWDNDHETYRIDEIPEHWQYVRFDTTNHLVITPFIVIPKPENNLPEFKGNKSFPMFGHYEDATPRNRLGSRKKRFEWVVEQARIQNPKIRISVTQFVIPDKDFSVLENEHDQDLYATSVVDLLAEYWTKKTARGVSLRIDGYDCDYEGSNVQPYVPQILHKIRAKINKYNIDHHRDRPELKPVFLSITPASTEYLDGKGSNPPIDLSRVIDYVNMQNYDGGAGLFAEHYIGACPNLRPAQFLVGISSENPTKNDETLSRSFKEATEYYQKGYEGKKYGGFWNWKLNSSDWVYNNFTQVAIFNRVHSIKDAPAPTDMHTSLEDIVEDGWSKTETELKEKYTLDTWKKTFGFRTPH